MQSALLIPLALAACATAAHASPVPYVLQPGHIDLAIGPDGNSVILDTPEGLVVVDTGRHAAHSARILDHARKTGKPVRAIVNTHWHLDHSTGNRDLIAAFPHARMIATGAATGALDGFLAPSRAHTDKLLADPAIPADARARLERARAIMADRAALIPAEPVTRDGRVRIGGRRFELRVARAAATEADLWLIVPDEKIAIAGDLVVAPVPFFDTGCAEGWKAALAAIAAARWTTLIPGHGASMTRTEFGRWRRAFDSWIDCASSSAPATACAEGWMRDAKGFYTEAEAKDVRMMARYYVEEVLRAPAEKRMTYCGAG